MTLSPLNSKDRTVNESITISSDMILSADLNSYGTVFGGHLVSLIDRVAAICGRKHTSGRAVVTVSIDHLVFKQPVLNGSILTIRSSVNRVFNTSMEIGAAVTSIEPNTDKEVHICTAYLTFVLVNEFGKPQKIPKIIPESELEKKRYVHAAIRRATRLKLLEKLS